MENKGLLRSLGTSGSLKDGEDKPMVSKRSTTYFEPVKDPKTTSFAKVVASDQMPKKVVNFRTLVSAEKVEETDFVLPVETFAEVKNKFSNSLMGFFVGKGVAFPLVKNYVTNTWGKYGFQKMMRDDDGYFYFKFTSVTRLEQCLEQGPWIIRNTPLILTKWSPSLSLTKDEVTTIPVWVKMLKVPVVAYTENGLSLIATQVGKPIMLDGFTSDMCGDAWGRIGYTRALIEIKADKELKNEVVMAIPLEDGTRHSKVAIKIEYQWKPAVCMECHVFGHDQLSCPKRIHETKTSIEAMDKEEVQADGFTVVKGKKKKGRKMGNHGIKVAQKKELKPVPKLVEAKQPNEKKDGNVVELKNQFAAIHEPGDLSNTNELGETSKQDHVHLDTYSEVDEVYAGQKPNTKRASTLSKTVSDV